MPKIPRDIKGRSLCKLLEKFGYRITRQTGSNIKLTSHFKNLEHSITIPDHTSIKIGTLNKILKDISSYLKTEKELLIKDLF